MEYSSEYIGRNLSLATEDGSTVTINPIIFEIGEFFVIKVLVLGSQDENPTVTPIGKIAGIDTFGFTQPYLQLEEPPFWQIVFVGNPLVQIVRAISYVSILLLLFAAILFLIDLFSGPLGKMQRKRHTRKYLGGSKIVPNLEGYHLFQMYIEFGAMDLIWAKYLSEHKDIIDRFYFNPKEAREGRSQGRIKRIIDSSLFTKTKSGYMPNQDIKNILDRFLGYLKQRKVFSGLDELRGLQRLGRILENKEAKRKRLTK